MMTMTRQTLSFPKIVKKANNNNVWTLICSPTTCSMTRVKKDDAGRMNFGATPSIGSPVGILGGEGKDPCHRRR